MPPTNYNTFRVRGIPAGTTRESLQALVAQSVSYQDASGVRVRSLAGDASRPRELVATVTFASNPEELSDTCGDWTIEGPQDITLVIDTHFHGCTTLYCPPANEWKSDLIAISGLNGHAFGSFKKKKSSYMWLRDSLPRDFPGCRIIIYGYDTKLQGSRSFQSLLDIGKKFQTAVRQVRQDARKPLILLGHSLGGIVVKEAISLMRGSSIDADKLTFAAIRGVIFFGVPNQGMDILSLIPMVGDQANRGFLHTLDHNSPMLRIQAKEFSAAIGELRCEILNFYETQESPTALQNEDGTWSMSGQPAVLVGTHSATHGRPDDSQGHQVSPIDCDHSSLIKFGSAYDEPYVTVIAFLQEIDSHGASPTVSMTRTEEACYQSLGFREQYQRMDSLEPSPGTCDWLTSHELFTEWLQSSKGLLWIRGKPGSGKSMAMKHALKHLKVSTRGIISSFFIHGQGAELQRSILGIYRSLLHQIYPYSPESFSRLTKTFQRYAREAGERTQDVKWSWMKNEIRQNLFTGLQTSCRKNRTIILVDALDEAGEEQAREVFKDLDALIDSLGDDCHLSLCVSCRHYPDISFSSGRTIVMENFNGSDIEHVLNSRLISEDIFNDSERSRMRSRVLARSEGIFQWTSLVTETIIRMRRNGDSFEAAMGNLRHVPKGLDHLYKALLEPKDEQVHELNQRVKLFQWTLLTMGPLAPQVLRHALALDSEMAYTSVWEYEQSHDFIAEHDFETKIKSLSKGLIQIKGSFEAGRIEFIHQSIPDFLIKYRGLELLSGLPGSDPMAIGHLELSMVCLKYLFMEEICSSPPQSVPDGHVTDDALRTRLTTRFPIFWYAWHYWIFHAVSSCGVKGDRNAEFCCAELMKIFCWPNDGPKIALWAPLSQAFGPQLDSWARKFQPSWDFNGIISLQSLWPCKKAKLIHLLAITGLLTESTQRAMSSDLESPVKTDSGFPLTPLCYAILGKQRKAVQTFTEAGVRSKYKPGSSSASPLGLASQWGDTAAVSSLLKAVNHKSEVSRALGAAAYKGHVEVINILIDAGAKVNSQFKYPYFVHISTFDEDTSPLHNAACFGKVDAVRQLIYRGADPNLKSLGRKAPPLLTAIRAKMMDIIKLLLSLGADINVRDSNGDSPIHYVFYVSGLRQLSYWNMNTKLHWSINATDINANPKPESLAIVEFLIQLGCDVNAKNKFGITPLHLSACAKSAQAVNLLLSRGADPNSKTHHGDAPIDWAAYHSAEVTQALLQAGANVHTGSLTPHVQSKGFPEHLAIYACDPIKVQRLISAGSAVTVVNCKGKTPLQMGLPLWDTYGRMYLAPMLLRQIVTDSRIIRDEIYAANTLPRIVKLLESLLKAGMDPNIRDDEGETALFWVVRSKKLSGRRKKQEKIEGVELLLKSGADPSITNRIGKTALSYLGNGDSRVAQLLREAGSPEGAWRRDSKFLFVTKRADGLTGLGRLLAHFCGGTLGILGH